MNALRLTTATAAGLTLAAALFPLAALGGGKPKAIDIAFDHFEKAQAYARIGQRREAIAEFEEAHRWSSQGDMLYNIAVLHRELAEGAPGGRPDDADKAIEYFQRYLGAVPRSRERAQVERWIAQLEQRRSQSAAAAKTEATANRQRSPTGERSTEAPAAGAKLEPIAARPEEAPRHGRPRWLRPVEGVLGAGIGIGVLTAGLGGLFVYDDGRSACDLQAPATQCPRLASSQGAGVGLLVGGGLVAVGSAVALARLELTVARRPEGAERERAEHGLSLVPVVSPGYAGLSIGGDL